MARTVEDVDQDIRRALDAWDTELYKALLAEKRLIIGIAAPFDSSFAPGSEVVPLRIMAVWPSAQRAMPARFGVVLSQHLASQQTH